MSCPPSHTWVFRNCGSPHELAACALTHGSACLQRTLASQARQLLEAIAKAHSDGATVGPRVYNLSVSIIRAFMIDSSGGGCIPLRLSRCAQASQLRVLALEVSNCCQLPVPEEGGVPTIAEFVIDWFNWARHALHSVMTSLHAVPHLCCNCACKCAFRSE